MDLEVNHDAASLIDQAVDNHSSHSVMKLPLSWMSVDSSGPGPRLVNLCGVFGGTMRIWPVVASICWSPIVNRPVPWRMMKISQ